MWPNKKSRSSFREKKVQVSVSSPRRVLLELLQMLQLWKQRFGLFTTKLTVRKIMELSVTERPTLQFQSVIGFLCLKLTFPKHYKEKNKTNESLILKKKKRLCPQESVDACNR